MFFLLPVGQETLVFNLNGYSKSLPPVSFLKRM